MVRSPTIVIGAPIVPDTHFTSPANETPDPLVTVKTLSCVVAPKVLAKVIEPLPAAKVRVCELAEVPSMIPPKLMAPPKVLVSMVEVAVRVVLVTPDAVSEFAVILPPILNPLPLVFCVVVTVRAPRRVVAPTVLHKVMMPPVPPVRVNA